MAAPLDSRQEEQAAELILNAAEGAAAVIFADFGYGLITAGLLNRVLKPLASRIPGWPLLRFLHMYLLKGGFLEGREALTYCRNIAHYEAMIRAQMAALRKARAGR